VVWTGLIWLRIRVLVNTVMNIQVPYNVGKFSSSCENGSFSRKAQLNRVS
jgi:hypothetical protein